MKKYFTSKDARSLIDTYGFSIFPVHGIKEDGTCTCGNKDCTNVGKHPATSDGFKSASNDIDTVKSMWAARKGLNPGIATGVKSGIFVIDIDSEEGEKNFQSLGNIPDTFAVKTAKGSHYYFKYPDEEVITKKGVLEGMDVRGDGGYVVGPEANHATGAVYTIQNPLEEFAPAPDSVLNLVCKDRIKVERPEPLYNAPVTNLFSDRRSDNEVIDILKYISPDIGYDEWIHVGMALHEDGRPFEIWDSWSGMGSKYDGSTKQHWRSFNKGGGVTMGTVVKMAKDAGWSSGFKEITPKGSVVNALPVEIEEKEITLKTEEPTKRTLPLIHASDIEATLDTRDFVEDLLSEEEFSVIYGESNCGKTFFMLDLAMHVALGKEWRGKEIEQGGVLYAALEGGHGTRNRIKAFKEHYNITQKIPLSIIPSSIDFLDDENDLPAFIDALERAQEENTGKIKLIVIDTLARAMSGGDENSSQDMGQLVIYADKIREITGAHISFIHHSGKDAAKGARGSSCLRAAVDTEIEISRYDADSPSLIKVVKQREMEMIDDMAFKLESIILGQNRRSKDVTSCVAIPCEVEETEKSITLNPIQLFIYDSIKIAMEEGGVMRPLYGGQLNIECITYDEMRKVMERRGFREVMATEKKNTAEQIKSATQAARLALKKFDMVNFDGSFVWLIH